MADELKLCPFCGSPATLYDAFGYCRIFCNKCGCGCAGGKERETAIAAWNTRVPPKAAPLVWEGNFSGPYTISNPESGIWWVRYYGARINQKACVDENEAKEFAQSHADALAYKLITGKEKA